jgi:hypothetical protein
LIRQETELERLQECLRRDRLDNDAKEIENDEKRLAIETRRLENERIQFFLQRAKEGDLAAAKELERSQ